jgi:hypothetical protein
MEDILGVTLAPTAAPTPPPTKDGWTIISETVDTKAVMATLSFDISLAEAQNAVMQLSMRAGFAKDVGLPLQFVEIESVTSSSRRLQSGGGGGSKTNVQFKATSEKAGDVDILEQSVKDNAAGGSIVAAIKQEASINGVLTKSLFDMANEVTVQTSVVDTTYTTTKEVEAGSGLTSIEKAAIAVSVIGVGYIFAVATGLCKKKGGKDDSYGQPEGAPVGYHNTEDSLGGGFNEPNDITSITVSLGGPEHKPMKLGF